LVLRKVVTLQEFETHWSLDDSLDAYDAIEYQDALQDAEIEKAREKSRGRN